MYEITSADAGIEPFARSKQCCTAARDGFFEILEASRKRPRFARLSETPRALWPPDRGVCSPTITPSGIGSAPRALWCLTRRGYIHPSPAALNR